MFGRMEQIALREMIDGREKLLARIEKLEADLERTNINFARMSEAFEAGTDQPRERKRGRA